MYVAAGEVGSATSMKLITNMLLGTMMAGIAETLALGEKVGLKQEQILEILGLLSADCPLYRQKGNGTYCFIIIRTILFHSISLKSFLFN